MPTGWFAAPFVTHPTRQRARRSLFHEYEATVQADKGQWAETEILGNYALVKVQGSQGLLTFLRADSRLVALPTLTLDDTLNTLPRVRFQALLEWLYGLGYTTRETQKAIGTDPARITFQHFLRFCTTRRLAPRWDETQQRIVLDGDPQPCRSITDLNKTITTMEL